MDQSDRDFMAMVSNGREWEVVQSSDELDTIKIRIGEVRKSFRIRGKLGDIPTIVCVETGSKYFTLSGVQESIRKAIRTEFAEDLK